MSALVEKEEGRKERNKLEHCRTSKRHDIQNIYGCCHLQDTVVIDNLLYSVYNCACVDTHLQNTKSHQKLMVGYSSLPSHSDIVVNPG